MWNWALAMPRPHTQANSRGEFPFHMGELYQESRQFGISKFIIVTAARLTRTLARVS